MNKAAKFTFIFIALLAYNFFIVDQLTVYFSLSNGMKTLTNSSIITLLSALLFAPLIEEFVFRWTLNRNNDVKYYIYLLVSACILLFVETYFGIFLITLFSFLFFFKYKFKTESKVHFNLFLFLAAISFCIVHIPVINAPTLSINIFMALIAFLPIGLFFSYTRVCFGLREAIIFHSIYNLLTLTINEIIY